MSSAKDKYFMAHALRMAQRGVGRTWPNPSVGCVLVKDGHVIAAARTGDGGRPHAEMSALKQAGTQAKGATAYVTLEPCAHEGETPSCARELVKAGVARVIIGCVDPDPRTAGEGINILHKAKLEGGVILCEGELRAAAERTIRGFSLRIKEQRPRVTLKIAATIDGKIALGNGESKWITGDIARRYVHLERAQHDAVFVGIGTVLADDPTLTARLPGVEHNAVRIVLDTNLRIPLEIKLFKTASEYPVWVFYKNDPEGRASDLEALGVHLFKTPDMGISTILKVLAQEGIIRLFIEGGAHVLTSFLKSGLYDRLLVFRAPSVIGEDGRGGITALNLQSMDKIIKLERKETRALGQDFLEVYEKCSQD